MFRVEQIVTTRHVYAHSEGHCSCLMCVCVSVCVSMSLCMCVCVRACVCKRVIPADSLQYRNRFQFCRFF